MGSIVSGSLPHITKEMSEWSMEKETEKEGNESEKTDSDIDEVWTNNGSHFFITSQKFRSLKMSYWTWKDIHQKMILPPPEA